MGATLRVFDTAEAVGRYAADVILARWDAALAARGVATLGCPAGRSPMTTYEALAARAGSRGLDGGRIHLLMMDDYLERAAGGWRACPVEAHYSCARFGETHIRRALNQGLAQPIPAANLHGPDPDRPLDYETTIGALGGVDVFLLASGASDGHVAFNPPGSDPDGKSRVAALAEATRADNLATFPAFASLDEVPRHGVSVSLGTISTLAHEAILVLTGAHKREAARRVLTATGFDPAWPATIVHRCRQAQLWLDRAASP